MKRKILGFFALVLTLSFTACNNDADTTTAEDTTSTTTTSSGDYAAMADEFQRNSEAGVYRDVRTGEPIKITVNRSTGAKLNAETNEPIIRYIWVDNNDWWVYDDQGTKLGRAKMENDKLLFETDDKTWVDYDTKWKVDGDETKMKSGDTKVKTEGDESKTKTDDGTKVKTDEDGTKVKKDD